MHHTHPPQIARITRASRNGRILPTFFFLGTCALCTYVYIYVVLRPHHRHHLSCRVHIHTRKQSAAICSTLCTERRIFSGMRKFGEILFTQSGTRRAHALYSCHKGHAHAHTSVARLQCSVFCHATERKRSQFRKANSPDSIQIVRACIFWSFAPQNTQIACAPGRSLSLGKRRSVCVRLG